MDEQTVTRAIVLWTGWGRTATPSRDNEVLVAEFGEDLGLDLLRQVRALEDDFYESKANHQAADLAAMGAQASIEFHARHPEIGGDAVQAFAWCYTYDYK